MVTSFLFQAHPDPHCLRRTDALAARTRSRNHALVSRVHHHRFRAKSTGSSPSLIVPPGPPFPENLHLKNMCGIVWCYAGASTRRRQPLSRFAILCVRNSIWSVRCRILFFRPCSTDFTGQDCNGIGRLISSTSLSDEAIALHVEHGSRIPTLLSTTHLYPINGKAHQVARSATPWSYREAVWAEVIVGVDPEPANRERIISWAKDYWEALHP